MNVSVRSLEARCGESFVHCALHYHFSFALVAWRSSSEWQSTGGSRAKRRTNTIRNIPNSTYTVASRQLTFLAAPGFGALSIVALDVFGIVDLVVTIRTFVGVAVDFLRG